MEELKQLMEALKKEWEQFKAENDRRLKEIAAKGSADPLTEEKIQKHSEAVGALQKQVDELQKKMQRPGFSVGGDELAEAKAQHRKAFDGYLRKGNDEGLGELQLKTLRVSVDADGGYAVPENLVTDIAKMERQYAPILDEVTVINAGGETYERLVRDGMAGSGWVGEESARPETASPTLASFKPAYGEVYANPKATQKMLDDAFFDVEKWIAEEIAEKFALDIDVAIISGDGTNKPKGILDYDLAATADATRAYGTIEKMHSGSAGSFTADNLLDLTVKLRPGYRQGAKWLMPGATVTTVRKFKDGNDNYIWSPGLVGQAPTLWGFPIIEDENVPAIAASANAVIFGNFKRGYKFVNVKGIRTLRDPYTEKPYVHFYTTQRVGGGVEDTRAFKVMVLAV